MSMICLIFGQLKFLISRDLLGSAGLAIGVLNLAIVVPQVAYSSQILHDHLVSFIYFDITGIYVCSYCNTNVQFGI